jgi:hypothetical protein
LGAIREEKRGKEGEKGENIYVCALDSVGVRRGEFFL